MARGAASIERSRSIPPRRTSYTKSKSIVALIYFNNPVGTKTSLYCPHLRCLLQLFSNLTKLKTACKVHKVDHTISQISSYGILVFEEK